MDLCGKKVVVTGGARGLGCCLVEKLVSRNAVVAVIDANADALRSLKRQMPAIHTIECDVSDFGQVAETMSGYHAQHGSADILVNNAGILYSAPLVGISAAGLKTHDIDMWNKVLATDLSSVFYMTVCAVEKMVVTRTRGVIVNVSSVSASGNAGQSAYSAAKAGVNALTAAWAKELGPVGIRVVGVAPGFSDTTSTKEALSEAVLQETIKRVPLRRLGKPEEIADGILAVIQNDFFNGKILELDGGLIV